MLFNLNTPHYRRLEAKFIVPLNACTTERCRETASK